MAKIIALSCTHKRMHSVTDSLLEAAALGFRDMNPAADIRTIRLIDHPLQLCVGMDECLTTGICPLDDAFYDIVDQAKGASGMILCMPVYGGNVPAALKIFMERLKTFMNAPVRPFGGLATCTIVHSRKMLTEAAMGALSPWFGRLQNENLVSLCLTQGNAPNLLETNALEMCRLAGGQLAQQMDLGSKA